MTHIGEGFLLSTALPLPPVNDGTDDMPGGSPFDFGGGCILLLALPLPPFVSELLVLPLTLALP